MLVGFEHIGATSRNLDRTIAFCCDLLGFRLVLRRPQPSGELAFLDAGGGMLEIFAPAAPIAPSRDVDAMIGRLDRAGVEIIEPPRNALGPQVPLPR